MKKFFPLLLIIGLLFAWSCKKDNNGTPKQKGHQEVPEGVLPVVFHVLYDRGAGQDPIQNPSASVFEQRIEQMNRFFAAELFPEAGSVPVDVQFMAATHMPDGSVMSEPGIHRVEYEGASSMSGEDFLKSRPADHDADIFWDPDYYVNVWLFGFSTAEYNVSGISFLPYALTAYPLEGLSGGGEYYLANAMTLYMHGIALNNLYFQARDDEGMFALVHEMGHYLGLKHVFSDDGCGTPSDYATVYDYDYSDDFCGDTPRYDRAAYEKGVYGESQSQYYRTSCSGQAFRSDNIMDYFYSDRTRFTPEQCARMQHVLEYSPLIPRSSSPVKSVMSRITDIPDLPPVPIVEY